MSVCVYTYIHNMPNAGEMNPQLANGDQDLPTKPVTIKFKYFQSSYQQRQHEKCTHLRLHLTLYLSTRTRQFTFTKSAPLHLKMCRNICILSVWTQSVQARQNDVLFLSTSDFAASTDALLSNRRCQYMWS